MLVCCFWPYRPEHASTGRYTRESQPGKIPAQIPIFPAKSLVHVMKAPQDRLSTHSRVCARAWPRWLGPSRSRRHLLILKNVLISPRWLPANGRPPPCPRLLPLPAMACPAAPPRDQGPRRGGSVGREGLSSGRSPLSSVADGAGAPAHHSAEQPYRPLGGAVRRGAVALAGICRGVWRLASRSPEAPGGW